MNAIEVYDPPMCCSTGVCGPEVDPELVRFAGDVEWLKGRGVEVRRYNLAQEPGAFVANQTVAEVLKGSGHDSLPLIVVGGQVMTRSIYPTREQLARLSGIEEGTCAADPDQAGDSSAHSSGDCCGENGGCC